MRYKNREERKRVIEAMGMTEHGNPLQMVEKVQNIEAYPEQKYFMNIWMAPIRWITDTCTKTADVVVHSHYLWQKDWE